MIAILAKLCHLGYIMKTSKVCKNYTLIPKRFTKKQKKYIKKVRTAPQEYEVYKHTQVLKDTILNIEIDLSKVFL